MSERTARLSRNISVKTMDRRTFLKRSGITVGAGAVAAQLPFSMIGEAGAKSGETGKIEVKRTVCTHCSVGCAIDAVVQNGVWIRQEPVFDSPLNLGAHCAKGASVREHGITHDSHRLKYPMKLEGGKWKKLSWGHGAMTNSYNDEQNSKCLFFLGSNAAEAHPVSMLHTLHAKENGCKVIVADPRFTRTAAKADKYVRFRSGTDVPFLFGVLHVIFKNGWEDKEYIAKRVYGMDQVKKEVMEKWSPQQASAVTGTPVEDIEYIAKTLAENRPGFIIWAMGQTQHNNANGVVRASNILMLALGNVGRSGGGCNIYRGHDNVQGATDIGPNPDTLPGYYPVAVPGSWS